MRRLGPAILATLLSATACAGGDLERDRAAEIARTCTSFRERRGLTVDEVAPLDTDTVLDGFETPLGGRRPNAVQVLRDVCVATKSSDDARRAAIAEILDRSDPAAGERSGR